MRYLLCFFFTLGLTACDGLDLGAIDSESNNLHFSSELEDQILFSSLLTKSNISTTNLDGFILIFKSSSQMDQIALASSASAREQALIGEYDWTITNQNLQVTYLNGIICTSTKTSETDLQFSVTTECDNPNNAIRANDRISGTLIKPLTLPASKFTNRTIVMDKESGKEELVFNSDGVTFTHKTYDDEANIVTINDGTYQSSTFTNMIKLNFTESEVESHSNLVLLSGDLDDGRLLELQYTDTTDDIDKLNKIFIHTADNNSWETHSLYDDIKIDE